MQDLRLQPHGFLGRRLGEAEGHGGVQKVGPRHAARRQPPEEVADAALHFALDVARPQLHVGATEIKKEGEEEEEEEEEETRSGFGFGVWVWASVR